MPSWEAKGKARAVVEQEGDGGPDGVVLPLQVTGSGVFDIAYTIEVTVGANEQKVSLQVDTGSSDLWITSKSCSSSLCGQTNGRNYDASSSTSTGVNFDINYIQGAVSGPIVWDKFVVGGYSIENQALAAADTIVSEPLSPLFSGILGLALPLNSIIAERIPPVTTNTPDGAAWASNLFSITPTTSAPSARFLSLSLSRPGSSAIPALLGIGRHPAFISDPAQVRYASLVSERMGTLFWKVGVRAISVWVEGEEKPVELGRSNSGSVFPSAVLDSGVPLILTTTQLANAIYGAIGVSPASDGQYYVPCTTPLNLTITLDDRPPLPLHPLDLTAEPPRDNQAQFCIGLIQPADAVLLAPQSSPIGDLILGVPFLRNVYSVMAYSPPSAVDGSFPPSSSSPSSPDVDAEGGGQGSMIRPRLGLLGLTDPERALAEFHTVRVLNQPISSGSSTGANGNGGSSMPGSNSGGAGGQGQNGGAGKEGKGGLSVGIAVLVGLLGFFALCLALFGVRWWFFRRRAAAAAAASSSASDLGDNEGGAGGTRRAKDGGLRGVLMEKEGGYGYALSATATTTRGSRDSNSKMKSSVYGLGLGGEELGEGDVFRTLRYEPYMQDHGLVDLTGTAAGVGVAAGVGGKGRRGERWEDEARERDRVREMGYRRGLAKGEQEQEQDDDDDAWDPRTATGREGMGREGAWGWGAGDETLVGGRRNVGVGEKEKDYPYPPLPVATPEHERGLSVGVPLLHEMEPDPQHEHEQSGADEFGVVPRRPEHKPIAGDEDSEYSDEGAGTRTSMAGVGTAARGGGGGKFGLGVGAYTHAHARDANGTTTTTSSSGAESEVVFRRMSGKGLSMGLG